MSSHERCPMGCPFPLVARVNPTFGTVYLECDQCHYVEPVVRHPDPVILPVERYTDKHGQTRIRKRDVSPKKIRLVTDAVREANRENGRLGGRAKSMNHGARAAQTAAGVQLIEEESP